MPVPRLPQNLTKRIEQKTKIRSWIHKPTSLEDDRNCSAILAVPSIVKSRQVYAFCNVILDPMAVPPFLWIDLNPIKQHAEVDMVTSGHSSLTARTHDLAPFHHVAFMDIDMAQVTIER